RISKQDQMLQSFKSLSARWAFVWLCAGFSLLPSPAQVMDGQLSVTIADPSGQPVPAQVQLEGRNPQLLVQAQADSSGEAVLRRLPPGVYELRVRQDGFSDSVSRVEIRSAVPQSIAVQLQIG